MARRHRAVVVLAHGDQTSLTEREAVDVTLRQVDRAVSGEELHVAQAAAGAMRIRAATVMKVRRPNARASSNLPANSSTNQFAMLFGRMAPPPWNE